MSTEARSPTVLDHSIDSLVLPSIIHGPIPDHTRVYFDLLGVKYIPVFKDGTIYYVLSKDAGSTCERYGMILGRRLHLPASIPSVRVPFEGLHIEDFYYNLSPHHQLVFGLHGIKYHQVEYNGAKIWVYDKAAEPVCKRFATSARPSQVTSTRLVVKVTTVKLPEYMAELPDPTRHYYELLGVDFVLVKHDTSIHHMDTSYIPIKYLDLVCDRLNIH